MNIVLTKSNVANHTKCDSSFMVELEQILDIELITDSTFSVVSNVT